jgi:hypothetical protein
MRNVGVLALDEGGFVETVDGCLTLKPKDKVRNLKMIMALD